jgi:secreted trypsin-like serine protease
MNVVPACLKVGAIRTEYFEGGGYGQDENNLRSNKLSKVFLKLVEMEICKNSYDLQLSEDAQICAKGYRDDLPVQDLCYGDSGSALHYMSSDMVEDETIYKTPVLVAVTSFGIGCAFGFPSVYVNISHYLDWMESTISS